MKKLAYVVGLVVAFVAGALGAAILMEVVEESDSGAWTVRRG